MKTTTLTTEQTKEIERLYKKYEASSAKVTWSAGYYDCNKQQNAASTRAYEKLVRYIESVTAQPAHQIIFKLINP